MQVKTVLIVEGIANLVMMGLKLSVGVVTNSAAIIGDALHSLTDMANNVIAYIAVGLSEQPSDRDHHYGHHKFEQIAVFALAVLLAVVAFELIINAIRSYGEVVEQSWTGLFVLLATLSINLGLTSWEHYWAGRLDSDLLRADAKHTLSDVLTTVAVIVGWQLAARGFYWVDTLFALIVAGIILFLAFQLFQRAIPILVDHTMHNPDELAKAVQRIDRVEKVHRIRARSVQNSTFADVTIAVAPELSTEQSHVITEQVEQALAEHFDIDDVVVHVEPDHEAAS
ncbi:MAG: cation diffusion facilitator family transporter [Arenicella sp.]|nr:cation diffusion facilitator family transporter [Arenicella sp.]